MPATSNPSPGPGLRLKGIVSRLREPSTYAGFAALCSFAGVSLPKGTLQDVAFAGCAVAGCAAVVMREGWKRALEDGDLINAVKSAAAEAAKMQAISSSSIPVAAVGDSTKKGA